MHSYTNACFLIMMRAGKTMNTPNSYFQLNLMQHKFTLLRLLGALLCYVPRHACSRVNPDTQTCRRVHPQQCRRQISLKTRNETLSTPKIYAQPFSLQHFIDVTDRHTCRTRHPRCHARRYHDLLSQHAPFKLDDGYLVE